jgi:glycosyltransferase involved in cell wall biosynthesis
MTEPLVSVILPTHNRARLVGRAIRSVLAQSYPNLELIVVDDASADDTPHVVRAVADPRMRYVRLDSNRGAAAARNLGVARASGALLAFQDDDDIWLPDKLRQQVPALVAAPDEVALNICSHIQMTNGPTLYVGGETYLSSLRFDAGLDLDFSLVATPGWLLRREPFERVGGFDERMRCWDDWELAARLARVSRFAHLDEVLWLQDRRREAQVGMFDNAANFANDHRLIAETLAAGWSPTVASRQWYLAGYHEAVQGDSAHARSAFRSAIKANPRNAKARVALALSYGGGTTLRAAARALRRARSAHSYIPRKPR